MKYSDVDILAALERGQIEVDPLEQDSQLGSMSVDLQLGEMFRVFRPGRAGFVDLAPPSGSPVTAIDDLMDTVIIPEGECFFLLPGELALGITRQRVKISADLVGRLDGRSSLARLGLMVHATAHTIDPGWDGRITLEFYNCGRLPLAMRPGMRICALSFETLLTPTSRPYSTRPGAKYREQSQPLTSRIRDEER